MEEKRIKFLQTHIKSPLLIKKKENLFYLTGRSFKYDAQEYLLVTKNQVVGFGSGLEQIDWVKKSDRLKNIGKYIKGKRLDLEWGFTFGEERYLRAKAKGLRAKPNQSPVDEMRQFKEPGELTKIKKSMQIVEKVFKLVRKEISKSGMTELRLAQFIETSGQRLGASDVSFPAIVASGSNAAIPHHVPSNKKIRAGESVIIDFGFKYKNYCSDFTRTVFLKRVPSRLEEAYDQVEKAYLESISFINSGSLPIHRPSRSLINQATTKFQRTVLWGGDVYQKCLDVLAETKLDRYFIHSLGHGTGLEIHELPNLSPKSKDVLRDGMVFSIEPGVYFPGVGGIRIEDLIYLKKGHVRKFIDVPTGLKENII